MAMYNPPRDWEVPSPQKKSGASISDTAPLWSLWRAFLARVLN